MFMGVFHFLFLNGSLYNLKREYPSQQQTQRKKKTTMQSQSPSTRHTCPMSHGHSVTLGASLLASEASLLKQSTKNSTRTKPAKRAYIRNFQPVNTILKTTMNDTRTFHAKPHFRIAKISPARGLDAGRNVVHLGNAHRERTIGGNYQDDRCDSPAQ